MRTVFMGTPSFSIPVLEALLSMGTKVVGIYTPSDKPSGRGRKLEPPPVKRFGLEHGITVLQPQSLRRAEVQSELVSLAPDLVVVVAYGKLLPPEVLKIPRFGCVNLHPSLLPRYRGPSPVATAILDGEPRTGMSVMLMDEGMDTGPVLAQRSIQISADATTEGLTPLLFQMGAQLVKEVLPLWVNGELSQEPQNQGMATITKKLERADGEARWQLSAQELERRLRAFTPWPGLYSHWRGKMVKILSAALAGDVSSGEAGHVVPLGPDRGGAFGIVTGGGVLGIRSLQLEGRRPVTSEEFLRGYGDFMGSKLPS